MKTRQATIEDFKVGTVLIDSEGNRHAIRQKYDNGIWETNEKCVFEIDAQYYKIEEKL